MTEVARVPAASVPDGKPIRLAGGPDGICLVRVGQRYFAVSDRCTHADVRLSEGDVDEFECTIECWKHGSAFSLADGQPLSLPATVPVHVFEVRQEGDDVVVVEP